MSNRYPILQSGFVAANESNISIHKTETDIVLDYTLSKTHLKNINNYFFSKNITAIYKAWIDNNILMNRFEFRESILKEAKQAFSFLTGGSFQKWIQLQVDKDTVTNMHMQFLNETVGFIFGKYRSISVHQWFSLLEVNNTSKHADNKLDYQGLDIDTSAIYSLEKVIQLWVSRDIGFEDLLCTLYVIFGERTAVTSTNWKHSG